MKVGVVGAGSWGTTLADLLARKGHQVRIWAREPEVVSAINRTHFNPVYLPGAPLAPALKAAPTIGEVVREAELVICVPPSHAMRAVGKEIAAAVSASAVIVSASKGLEPDTLDTMTAVLEELLPNSSIVALSGPSFAQEVHARQPTAVVAASRDPAAAELTQQSLSARHFRVYTSDDVIGVQLGGALKNVIAIAAGILEGMGLGNNTRAALITRGLAEMTRLGEALGADASTFAGLAGMGDLILTATGTLSRNRSLGVEIGHGRTLAEILAERRTVAEGVGTSQAAVELGTRAGVELPIAYEVAQVLFEGKQPSRAIADLMDRELKAERWR
ncbi:MAG TPA: NAD(P)H-dependent glycerol-3-phosphate dehydrogenase [Gemmatimonadales bacterium]|nr:NAD(P)H-dependent glycerol-3-phosphate dehydrogenase [Gemmatimonadales bacterium]